MPSEDIVEVFLALFSKQCRLVGRLESTLRCSLLTCFERPRYEARLNLLNEFLGATPTAEKNSTSIRTFVCTQGGEVIVPKKKKPPPPVSEASEDSEEELEEEESTSEDDEFIDDDSDDDDDDSDDDDSDDSDGEDDDEDDEDDDEDDEDEDDEDEDEVAALGSLPELPAKRVRKRVTSYFEECMSRKQIRKAYSRGAKHLSESESESESSDDEAVSPVPVRHCRTPPPASPPSSCSSPPTPPASPSVPFLRVVEFPKPQTALGALSMCYESE